MRSWGADSVGRILRGIVTRSVTDCVWPAADE